ncbi:helix-turn-helix domain-containing protein [Salinicoccus roseus]|uniref:helix-turn-helix domain-containing protein n=1 Tax=Salinicoccus roseus TaxID=45670 RepID=UPI00230047A0|nr:helix-turn-helix domain-containing protein [Salinicoccus roseus]
MLAKNLARLRKRKGYSQKYVAELLHISPQAYHRYERTDDKNNEPNSENLAKLADLYDVTVDELLGRKSVQNDPFEDADALMFSDKEGFDKLSEEDKQELKDMLNDQLEYWINKKNKDKK